MDRSPEFVSFLQENQDQMGLKKSKGGGREGGSAWIRTLFALAEDGSVSQCL